LSTHKNNTVKIWFAISITLMLLLFILPTSAQETLTFGVEEGATWTLHHEAVSVWESEWEAGRETDISNMTIIFLNVTGNTIYLNHSVFGESTYQGKNETETYAYNHTEVYTYNLTDFTKFLNEKIMTGEFPYILPVNWSLIENTLQQLNRTDKTTIVYFKEVPKDYIGDKPVDIIFITVEINKTESYTSDNTNYTHMTLINIKGKYGKKTGILLEENYFYEHCYYENNSLTEYYNSTETLWITNSSFTYWETEVTEQPSENETFPEITATTVATSTSGAISGIISATAAVATAAGVSGVSTTVTTSVGQAAAPSLVPGEEATKGFESARSKFSWKYLKYLLKLRKLKRKKKKEEIPPPKNTIKMTIALAIIGAITGSGAAAIAYGLSAPLTLLVMLVTAVIGFTLAEAGLSLFIRRYVFYRVRSIQWGKKEKLSLLIILITGLYGVVTSFISATLLAKAAAALVTSAVIPTGIIAYFTAEEVTMMMSAE